MTKKRSKQKNDKGEARTLAAAAKRAFDAGDYLSVREINNRIAEVPGAGELAALATEQNSNLDFDPFLKRFAMGAWGVYLVGWGVGLL